MHILLLAAALFASTPGQPLSLIQRGFDRFPRINQLREVTHDGHKSENAEMNCIPASIAAGLEYLTGKSYSGDGVKEAVYGRTYTGPTQIYRYLGWVKEQGVEMRPVLSHNPEVLVAELRKLLESGTPAVISIPGDVNRPPSDLLHPSSVTHVVIAAGFDENGNIRVMNPWGGVWLEGNDAFWASRICYGELWAMERLDENVVPGPGNLTTTVAKAIDDKLDKPSQQAGNQPSAAPVDGEDDEQPAEDKQEKSSAPMRVLKALSAPIEAAVAAPGAKR